MMLARTPGANRGSAIRGARVLIGVLLLLLLAGVALMVLSPTLAEHFVFFPSRADPGDAPEIGGIGGRDVLLESADDVWIHGWWHRVDGAAPAVVFFHGNAGNIAGRAPIARGLLERGISVLMIDYRGYGRSEGSPDEEGIVRDGRAAVDYLRGEGIPVERTVLFGRSLGSWVAARLAAEEAGAGLIVESAFTDLREMAGAAYPFLPDVLFRRLEGHFDIGDAITRSRVPLLVVHGTDDTLVPPEMGRRIHRAAADPKAWYPVEGAGHNDVYYVGGEAYFDRLTAFIREAAGRE